MKETKESRLKTGDKVNFKVGDRTSFGIITKIIRPGTWTQVTCYRYRTPGGNHLYRTSSPMRTYGVVVATRILKRTKRPPVSLVSL